VEWMLYSPSQSKGIVCRTERKWQCALGALHFFAWQGHARHPTLDAKK